MNEQMSLIDLLAKPIITKPIRLIQLFAGYGSQTLALRYLGVPHENHRISEWALPSIRAYKDLHAPNDTTDYSAGMTIDEIRAWFSGRISRDYNKPMTDEQIRRLGDKQARTIFNDMRATNNLGSITKIKGRDLAITDTGKYDYILFYSFPCQDLSVAGKMAGMGEGTRSGLLWEVGRLLDECDELPQILVAENVPALLYEATQADFRRWRDALKERGYETEYFVLNAKDYGIPQNRERVFVVSTLSSAVSSASIPAPKPYERKVKLREVLQRQVGEEYYLSDKAVQYIVKRLGKFAQIYCSQTVNVERERERICEHNPKGRQRVT